MVIAHEYGWDISAINYYVAEYTDNEYSDIYSLPEAYFEGLIEYISQPSEEEGE